MTEQNGSGGEDESLPRGVLRDVARHVQHMHGLEVRPQRMRRIRHPPMGESVAVEQIREVIVVARQRHPVEQSGADGECERCDDYDQQGESIAWWPLECGGLPPP